MVSASIDEQSSLLREAARRAHHLSMLSLFTVSQDAFAISMEATALAVAASLQRSSKRVACTCGRSYSSWAMSPT
jgi:hypothetical protein